MILDEAICRQKFLKRKILECRKLIKSLPPGRLECHKDVNRIKWYVVKNGKKKYLSKKELSLARRLAYKRRLQSDLDGYIDELNLINQFIDSSKALSHSIEKRCARRNIEIERLASEYHLARHPEISVWESSNYEHLEWGSSRKVRSLSGHYFSSKDEAMIDDLLHRHGLLVRYEEKLVLCDRIAYPDFHILNPRTGQDIYWEHFGMVDDVEYLRKNIKKLRSYMESGYYPMINFITTFMGGEFRIDELWIEAIIDFFFEKNS